VTALLLLAAVPAVALGLPRLARSEWARAKVEARLSRAARAEVRLERLEFCWKDGLRLLGIAVPPTPEGGVEVSFRVPEARVRLSRRPRVTLFSPDVTISLRPEAAARPKASYRLDRVELRDATVRVESPSLEGGLLLERLDGRLSLAERRGELSLSLARFSAAANGGTLEGALSIRRGPRGLSIGADLTGEGIASNELLVRVARGAAPVLESASRGDSYGRLSFSLKGAGAGASLNGLFGSARADGSLAVRDARIASGKASPGGVVREVDGRFSLHEGRLLNPSLEVRFESQVSWRLMGWTSATGRLDYAVRPSEGAAFSLSGTLDEPRRD
jgi:hypothetical protein